MKKLFALSALISYVWAASADDFTRYVNPLAGTLSSYELSAGNTYPAIARPWGMNFWTPQTGRMGDGWQYVYTAGKIRGFKQTHQPSPWINDYGQFSIMPVVGRPEFDEDRRASWFSHKSEEVLPYYYKVYLAEHDVLTEFTPTDRAVLFRFTFPESDRSYIVVDAFDKGSYVKILPESNRIIGYTTRNSGGVPENFKNYFVIEFDKSFTYKASVTDGVLHEGTDEQRAEHAGVIVGFKTRKGETVHVRAASSFISFEQAHRNLKELGNDGFDTLVRKGKDAWNKMLGRIELEGGTFDQYRTFYSCLYRSLLFPRAFHEFDEGGNPIHYSPYNGKVLPGYMYTDTGFWDTFRSLFPFLNLMYPSVNRKIQEGLLNAYKESGFFPEWASPGHRDCMIGNNSASVLADAYLKGVRVSDVQMLYEGLLHGTENVHPKVSSTGRLGHEYYNEQGYVPYNVHINENVARTLEYAYDDWCIYRMAKALNRPEEEQKRFAKRAMNYREVFDKESKLMRGRNKDGRFQSPFSPLKWGDAFTEGNSWHYSWSVFHDPQGLINLMGGEEAFVTMLDSVFIVPPLFDESYYGQVIHEIREMTVMNMGNYAHGNQPIQHMIYLYNYAGQPWKAQYWLRQVMNRMYTADPDGYCGDEDNGQTSAWYVFSALGFYPVCPGTDEYVLGAPLFKRATLHFENGHSLVIDAAGNSPDNLYIESLRLNGNDYTKNYLRHGDLWKGGTLTFRMSDRPNKKRGTHPEDYPYSFSHEEDSSAQSSDNVRIIPQPQYLHVGTGQYVLPGQATFYCNLPSKERVDLVRYLENSSWKWRSGSKKSPIAFIQDPSCLDSCGEEGYRLAVNAQGIRVEAASSAGLFYAFQSLLQLARPDKKGRLCLPYVEIRDVPRFPYRGLHFDVSRHFRSKEFIKKQLDALAHYKINRFHWHLTDGAGWRIEIKRYPELTRETAYRPFPDWKSWWKGARTYCEKNSPGAQGGYYTQEDIREVVEYARCRHITIIPEIEMPSHSEEVLAVYPQLACGGNWQSQGEFCPGKEETYTFLTNVLTEIMELFPSEYIHIGGDESSTVHWKNCPDCQDLLKRERLKDEGELQGYLVHRIEAFLKAHGRKMIGWDEILSGELSEGTGVTVWRDEEMGAEAVRRGLYTVMSPGSHCYLDFYQDAPATQPEAIGGYTSLQKVYSYNPVAGVQGVQANVWTEYMPTADHAEYMMYPRVLALAEVSWTPTDRKDWKSFRTAALREVDSLRARGYRPFDLRNEVGERPVALAVDAHLAKGKRVEYHLPYSRQYKAGGDSALTDGLHGGWTYGDHRWQGFLNSDINLTVDLERQEHIGQIAVDFMQLIGPYVWLPREVTFSVSVDGKEFTDLKQIVTELPVTDEGLTIQTYAWRGDCHARYVRLTAKSNGIAGGWLFLDECVVRVFAER